MIILTKPRIEVSERKIWDRFMIKNGYVQADGKGTLELTMKGQQMLIILNELKKKPIVKPNFDNKPNLGK